MSRTSIVPKSKITNRLLQSLKPDTRSYIIWDSELAGFGVKVTPGGKRVFIFQYRMTEPGLASVTPPTRLTIGTLGAPFSLNEARKEAEKAALQKAQGTDPRLHKRQQIDKELSRRKLEKAAHELKFRVKAEEWLLHLDARGKSHGYRSNSASTLRRHLIPRLGNISVCDVSAEDIYSAIQAIPSSQPYVRVAVFDTAYAMLKWLSSFSGGRILTSNVASFADRPPRPAPRDRVLDRDELSKVWIAAGDLPPPWRQFFRSAILTGKRRGELSRARWQDINLDNALWEIPASATKNGKVDVVPLSDVARGIFVSLRAASNHHDAEYVFAGRRNAPIANFSKMKRTLDNIVGKNSGHIPDWRIHDLRRTFATRMQALGVRFEVTEALLNHTGKSGSGVAGIYQRHDWQNEKREAVALFASDLLADITVQTSSNVRRLGIVA